jgi:subtilisin-like proprotein convertase family protein
MTNPKLRLYCSLFIAIFFFQNLSAQPLEVNPTIPGLFSAEDILSQVFVNQGVDVLNVTYEGDEIAVGEFKDGFSHFGIDEGIVLSTGRAASDGSNGPFGADGVGTNFASSDNNSSVESPSLSTIAVTNSTNDVGRFLIEFMASSDSVRFQYVFASEEYPEFACTAFNDAMGLFISGPGISGPYENGGINIALVPDTTIPVAINNVHPENGAACPPQFEDLYNDNNQTSTQPVYNGFLDVFYSVAQVIPGEIYTLEIVIGDGGDNVFDSALFLAAESFGSDSLVVNTDIDVVSALVESGGTIDIPFDFSGTNSLLFPVTYQIGGTAEYGIDYQSSLPVSGVINTATDLLNWSITPTMDGNAEAFEYIEMRFDAAHVVFEEYFIYFLDEVDCELPDDVVICEAAPVELSVASAALDSTFYFENTEDFELPASLPGHIFSNIDVSGVPFQKLSTLDIIESICLNIDHSFLDDLDLYLFAPDGSYLELSTDNGQDCDDYTNTCFTPTATTVLTDIIPLGYDCSAGEMSGFTGDFKVEGNWRRLLDTPVNGTWRLAVRDDSQGFSGTLLDWSITFSSKALRDFPVLWSTGETSLSITVLPTETTTYEVSAGPNCSGEITVEVQADITNLMYSVCENESVIIDNIVYDINNPSAEILYQNQAGCDSLVTIELTFLESPTTLLAITIDEGEVYDFNGNLLSATGIYEQVFTNVNGCDSLVTLDLTVFTPPFILLDDDVIAAPTCDLIEYCLPLAENDLNQLMSIELNGGLYTDVVIACVDAPVEMGAILLPVGENEVILTDQDGYADTTVVTVTPEVQTLPLYFADTLSESLVYPLSNLPICGNTIVSVTDLCPDMNEGADYLVNNDLDTLVFSSTSSEINGGTFCLEFCDDLGFCFLQTFELGWFIVSTEEILSENNFQLFPTPTSDFFYLKTSQTEPINAIELFALNGQLLKTWQTPNLSESFDIQGLSAGAYYLKIGTTAGIVVKKIIKE